MGSIHTMEHYSAIERNGTLQSAPTWMDHEKVMLSNRSQSPKDTFCMMPRTGRTGTGTLLKAESSQRYNQKLTGRKNGELLFNGHRVSIWDEEKVLETDHSDGCTTLWMYVTGLYI